ncbi:MAG TPA: hypothetical protein VJP76_04775 [Candidatus Tumulicola sp.]|nr:hypothetical protein [Candidatus Tumulicola sp.]
MRTLRWVAAWLSGAVAAAVAPPAEALPIFAHRYGLSCQACHTTVPTLNGFGRYFLRHGFRLPDGRGTFPVTVKTQMTYSSAGSGDSDEPGGSPPLPKFIVDEVELLSAGSIGRNTSYYLEQYAVDGGEPGQPRDMWVNFDRYVGGADPIGPALHAKLGEFTLPLPVDPETQRPTLSPYLLYDQVVANNAFDLFDPGIGADLYYTDDRHGFEAHFDTLEAYTRESGIPVSGVNFMATLSKTIGNDVTLYAYRYQGRSHLSPIADSFYRQAYGAGYARGKFDAVGIIQTGYDTSACGFGAGAPSSGGFLQTSWEFDSALALYARYDSVYDPFDLRTNQGTLSLVVRPAGRYRLTIEGTRSANAYQFGTGLLFAY